MADEIDKTKDQAGDQNPKPKDKPYVNPINLLTPEQWKEAMRKGLEDSANQSAIIRQDITIYYWRTAIPEAIEEVSKAQTALRAYLERPATEPRNDLRHPQLADDLKRATDKLTAFAAKYIWIAFDDPPRCPRQPQAIG